MPDVPARIGVPVYEGAHGHAYYRCVHPLKPTHIAFPTSPEAVSEMQQRLARRIGFDLEGDIVDNDECAWNLMAILGFTDA